MSCEHGQDFHRCGICTVPRSRLAAVEDELAEVRREFKTLVQQGTALRRVAMKYLDAADHARFTDDPRHHLQREIDEAALGELQAREELRALLGITRPLLEIGGRAWLIG